MFGLVPPLSFSSFFAIFLPASQRIVCLPSMTAIVSYDGRSHGLWAWKYLWRTISLNGVRCTCPSCTHAASLCAQCDILQIDDLFVSYKRKLQDNCFFLSMWTVMGRARWVWSADESINSVTYLSLPWRINVFHGPSFPGRILESTHAKDLVFSLSSHGAGIYSVFRVLSML